MNNNFETISKVLPKREIYEMLAEETAELSQAALKCIRAEKLNLHPTDKSEEDAKANLEEEMNDVLFCIYALGFDKLPSKEELNNSQKMTRLLNRLKSIGVL